MSMEVKYIFIYSNGTVIRLIISKQVRFNGSITNISVKEVGQDWTFVGDFETDGTKAYYKASQYSSINQIK